MILQEVEQIEEISVSFKDPMQGKLRIGLIPTLGPYLLPFMIPAMIQEYPRLQLFLYEEQTHILLNKLNNAELDAIVLALPVSNNGFYEIELFDEPFLLALPRGHELSIKEVCLYPICLKKNPVAGRRTLPEGSGPGSLHDGRCYRKS